MDSYDKLEEDESGYVYIIKLNKGNYGSINYDIIFSQFKKHKKNVIKEIKVKNLENSINFFKIFRKDIKNNTITFNTYPKIINTFTNLLDKNYDEDKLYNKFYEDIKKNYRNKRFFKYFKNYIQDINKINNNELKCLLILELYKLLAVKTQIEKKKSLFSKSKLKSNELNHEYIKNINKMCSGKEVILCIH